MLNFVKKVYRVFFGALLWLNLAVWTGLAGLGGYVGGENFLDKGIIGLVVGLVVGAIVGLLINIFVGGYLATFIEMGNDIAAVKTKMADIETRLDSLNANVLRIKESADTILSNTAGTLAVFQRMENRGRPAGSQNANANTAAGSGGRV